MPARPRPHRLATIVALGAAAIATTVGSAAAEEASYTISGTVSIPEGAPAAWLTATVVRIATADGILPGSWRVFADGSYEAQVGQPGDYVVIFDPAPNDKTLGADRPNLVREYWPGTWAPTDAQPVAVAGQVTGIDAALDRGTTISGAVTIADARTRIEDWPYDIWATATSVETGASVTVPVLDAGGAYDLVGLAPGAHTVCVETLGYDTWLTDAGVWVVPQCWGQEAKAAHAPAVDTAADDRTGVDILLPTAPHFEDVVSPVGHPSYSAFADEIYWLGGRGISTGYPVGDGTVDYRPFAPVTRDAMAAFLHRYAGSPTVTLPARSPFADVPATHPFYAEIVWLSQQGVTTGWDVGGGRREFRPARAITRDAMAAFLYRYAGAPAVDTHEPSPFADVTPASSLFYDAIAWLDDTGITTGWTAAEGAREFRPFAHTTRDAMAAFLFRFDDLG